MLQIYSDAGVWNNVAAVSSLIFEDWDTYVTLFAKIYEGINECTTGETLGAIQGLEWVLENRPDVREVHLLLDCASIVSVLQQWLKSGNVNCSKEPPLRIRLFELCSKFDTVKVDYSPAHMAVPTPNSTCDCLCTALLAPYKRRESLCTQ